MGKDSSNLLVYTASAIVVAKRPQIAAIIKQQAHAARPPTGPSAAPIGLTMIECLVYTHTLSSLEQILDRIKGSGIFYTIQRMDIHTFR